MVNFTVMDPVELLEGQLLEAVPSLADLVADARSEWGDPSSAYWYFTNVVKPYVERLLTQHDEPALTQIFTLLEEVAGDGFPSTKEDLFVTMEELDLWKLYRWLGPLLREQWFDQITSFPKARSRFGKVLSLNAHVDKERYGARWQEEIEAVGGFEHLTDAAELEIRYRLKREFRISGLRAPKPGGREWRSYDLPWPLPPRGE